MAQSLHDPTVLVTQHPCDTAPLQPFLPPCSPVNIWIPSVIKETKGGEAYHVYQVLVKVHHVEWNVYRRYSEFRAFHKVVRMSHDNRTTVSHINSNNASTYAAAA